MTNSVELPLSDDELDALDTWLLSDRMPEGSMDLAVLDGFLAALAVNPAIIPPSEWLAWVWDRESATDAPSFETSDEASQLLGLILRHYNTVVSSIERDRFDPVLDVEVDAEGREQFDAGGWCAGFMLGVNLYYEPYWARASGERVELMAPMLLLGTEHGLATLARNPNPADAMRGAIAAIPELLHELKRYFAPMRAEVVSAAVATPFRRAEVKTGRNDPCPCGSGKKFKKCCGADA
ncbi:MAG: UPF0149 family protein [Thiotrichales bacterium]